jgi:CRISPR system Cascade subunit CasE
MFLSRVEIPWEAGHNPYEIHRKLWHLFPGEARETRSSNEDARHGFLFRVEQHSAGRPVRILVQSRMAPVDAKGLSLLGSREFAPAPSVDQRLAFLLTVNPVKTIVDAQAEAKPDKLERHARKTANRMEDKPRPPKSRVPLIEEEQQRQWLVRKLEGAASLETAQILPHAPVYFRKGNQGGKLVTCTFEGVLRVASPERLVDLMSNGIGPAKSFGCGLMLVRRMG